MEDLKNGLWEAAKVPLRALVLAIIPVLITWLSGSDWKYAKDITLILTFIDIILHKIGKEIENENISKGLARF